MLVRPREITGKFVLVCLHCSLNTGHYICGTCNGDAQLPAVLTPGITHYICGTCNGGAQLPCCHSKAIYFGVTSGSVSLLPHKNVTYFRKMDQVPKQEFQIVLITYYYL